MKLEEIFKLLDFILRYCKCCDLERSLTDTDVSYLYALLDYFIFTTFRVSPYDSLSAGGIRDKNIVNVERCFEIEHRKEFCIKLEIEKKDKNKVMPKLVFYISST